MLRQSRGLDDVIARVTDSAAMAGDRVAVQRDGARLTYHELEQRTNGLAEVLADRGVVPGEPVLVCLDPGPLAAVALLGILKAGAAYVPVAPSDPVDRLRYVAADTAARMVLTEHGLAEHLRSVDVDTIEFDVCVARSSTAPPRTRDGQMLAYILYTSGSSGHPKGVAVTHDNLCYYLGWHLDHLRPAAGDIDLPLSSSLCFAAAVTQFYTPLLLGQTQHVLARDTVRDPNRVLDWFAEHPDYGIYCVPTLWSALLRAAEHRGAENPAPGPRCALLSGEAVAARLVERSFRVWPQITLWNLYGPTEAVANASAGELRRGRPPTIGKPIAGTRIVLADERERPVGPGETGEICICGPGVARGYVNLEELTRQRFAADPGGAGRLFRTGDMATYDDRGELVFVGRRDFQVKVRGHRVECSEIEQALAGHHAVREVAVVARRAGGENGDTELTAYVIFLAARYASVDELRRFLAGVVPDYMIPSCFVALDVMPQLLNGKIDRRRLPAPGRARPALLYPFRAPKTVRETRLIRIWERVLGLEGLGTNDDFFDLGGNSLKAAAAIAQIRETLHCHVSYRELFDHPTPAGLAAVLLGRPQGRARTPLRPTESRSRWPCAENQRSVWLLTETFGEISAYNMQFSMSIDGLLDAPLLASAVRDSVARHDALHSTIRAGRDGPEMVSDPGAELAVEIVDLLGCDGPARDHELTRRDAEQRARRFDLNAGPLLRPIIYRLADDRHVLSVTVHHLVFDGSSIGVFCRDVLELYDARRAGRPPARACGQLRFQDWCVDQDAEPSAALAEFWRGYLDGCPTGLDLPTDYPRPAVRGFDGAVRTARVDARLRTSLTALARRHRATPFMLLHATFSAALHRWAGQDDIVVGCPVANRRCPGAEDLVGFLANTIVLRTRLSADQTFEDVLASGRTDCLAAFEHQEVPFETVLEIVGPDRHLGQSPIFQVMFAYHEQAFQARAEGLRAHVSDNGTGGAKYDLVLDVHEDADTWKLRFTYRTDLYAERTVQRWLDQYVRLLGAIAVDPRRAIAEYDLSCDDERRRLRSWNLATRTNVRERSLCRLFEEQAASAPERTALIDGERALDYAELDRRARLLAARLREAGVSAGALVGVHVEPSAEMVIALLAVLKTGAAFVPLDPYYPSGRIGAAIADSGLGVIVSSARLAEAIAEHGATVVAVDSDQLIAGRRARGAELAPGLMYVMYTSGSTGRPKGVMVGVGGPANFVLWMRERFGLTSTDRVLSKTSINFDISVWEIFLPLVSGAPLVVARPHEQQAPDALAALIRRERITTIQFVPSALRAFVDSGRLLKCESLTHIFAGGEALPARLAGEVLSATGAELHNLYGPTEASIYSTHWPCHPDDRHRSVPIGRPIDNTAIHILDSRMRPAPIGTAGDLYIGGAGIAEGYLGQPQLSAAAFVHDPFSTDGSRLFKTNDRARFLDDGEIEFLGRADNQVKVRGYRVELDEIAHHLNARSDVRHAIVITREDEADDVRLVAYLLYQRDTVPSDVELRAYLKQRLPDYMIPAAFVGLDSIPLLPNDKADFGALPAPDFARRDQAGLQPVYVGERERELAEIWEMVLRSQRFGPEDSFFDVGGHSLLIARLGALIDERLGVEVSNIELFQFPTIRTMAAHLAGRERTSEGIASEVASEMARRVARRNATRALWPTSVKEA